MDADGDLLRGRRSHERFIIFGLQTFARNQTSKGPIHERIGKLIHDFTQVLNPERFGENGTHIPLIPSDRLPICRQNHIFFSSTMKPLPFRPPAFQGDLS